MSKKSKTYGTAYVHLDAGRYSVEDLEDILTHLRKIEKLTNDVCEQIEDRETQPTFVEAPETKQ